MRNPMGRSGVYRSMLRVLFVLTCSMAAVGQPVGDQDPLDAAIQTVWRARRDGRFEESAAAREQARTLLQKVPVDSPRYAGWTQQVSQFYASSLRNGEARAILQDALARTAPLGNSSPQHVAMLSALAESWWQDGNLLKALGYLEQAASAQAAVPAAAAPQTGIVYAGRTAAGNFSVGGYNAAAFAYSRLADLYQTLGRPDAVAATAARIRALGPDSRAALAQFYDQHGQPENAAAIYEEMARPGAGADAQQRVSALQSLANLDVRLEHYGDAVSAMQQAIAAVPAASNAGVPGQTLWMRQTLARYLSQAGMVDQGDVVYQEILQESSGTPQATQMLVSYAQYLGETKRGAQGLSLLKDQAAQQPDQAYLLFNLSSLSRVVGDAKGADEYQKAAAALQPQPPRDASEEGARNLQSALNQRHYEDAYGLAVKLLDAATALPGRQQIIWRVPAVANQLAVNGQPAKGEQLFQRLLAVAEGWKADDLQPYTSVTQSYAQFLMNQPDRLGDVPAALERFRAALVEGHGPESGNLAQVFRMKLQFAQSHQKSQRVDEPARELLEFQESLSGNTSEPYLHDLQEVARAYSATGNPDRALPLFHRAIAIADLTSRDSNNGNRSQARMETAWALANLKQFDEAVKLVEEAVNLSPGNQRQPYVQQLEQIRQMQKVNSKRLPD